VPEIAASLLAFALSYVAFALFALGQPAHLKAVDPLAPGPSAPKRHRLLAALLLASALSLLVVIQGGAFGFLLWMTLLSAAALSLSFTLSWRPGWLRSVARFLASTHR
jgi:nitrate reductase NapE component